MLNSRLSLFFLSLTLCFWGALSMAGASQGSIYHRDFWSPTYHIQRLNYCLIDGKICGMKVADRYCHLMGYERADREVIEYNVGFSHYLATNASCKNERCNGFKVIRCENKIIHQPAAPYYYRQQKFVVPRFNHERMDWCLERGQHCGKPVATSFCRRRGYMEARTFKKEAKLPRTKTLGSQELCMDNACDGFREVTCYR